MSTREANTATPIIFQHCMQRFVRLISSEAEFPVPIGKSICQVILVGHSIYNFTGTENLYLICRMDKPLHLIYLVVGGRKIKPEGCSTIVGIEI